MLFFQVMTDGTLLQPLNLTNLVLQNSYIVIMALGMLLVIVAGHIDLSVGSVRGFIGALAAVLMVQYEMALRAGHHRLPRWSGARDRRGAGLVRSRISDPVVHRHAGRHAGVQGPGAGAAAGAVGRAVPADVPEAESGFIPDCCSAARRCASDLAAARRRCWRWRWSYARLRERAQRAAHGMEVEPYGVLRRARTLLFAARASSASASCWRRTSGLPNVLVDHGAADRALRLRHPRTTIGRRIYALGGNEKAARLSGIKTERLTFLDLRQHGRARGARRPRLRRAPEHRDAEGGPRLRARRDRRLLHRRRLGLGRRRQGDGRGDRRLRSWA